MFNTTIECTANGYIVSGYKYNWTVLSVDHVYEKHVAKTLDEVIELVKYFLG